MNTENSERRILSLYIRKRLPLNNAKITIQNFVYEFEIFEYKKLNS